MDPVDLNDIRIFTVVGQESTLSSAAGKLKLPTSTVSRSVTRLEKDLGALLVRRSSRGHALTDSGKEYLQVCRRALRTLDEGGEMLAIQRERPSGLIKVACPVTMTHLIFAPLLTELQERYPHLRLQIESYTPSADQEFREEIDVVFKVRAPRDSIRRMRNYPSTRRGLFASARYIETFGMPSRPEELTAHTCIGSGPWQLSRGDTTVTPNIQSPVILNDPTVLLDLTLRHHGIALLPLYMGRWPETGNNLIPVLPRWSLEPVTLCALFSGQSRLIPKLQVLLDFLGEYIGTPRDPRLRGADVKGLFTNPRE
ncbi:Transcriptional regulator, LysR family [Acidisarcina polymorpha]|uniref:Transcriptional regulator, LysR family n=1 Tax=Acidisarcina polymorpha TaxID=2211140 RepID=A0A2Z5G044_9BACT|nr:LysR family transcriptional regulator [Acidisarcina polymorpha]AXC11956.1 Transcriptional regulator, LysR family [Acidisarcina polymorpha]